MPQLFQQWDVKIKFQNFLGRQKPCESEGHCGCLFT